MYFEEFEEGLLNPELLHIVQRELYSLQSTLDISSYRIRNVPTHTEDGIPIRKLYVSNLPPKTSRKELFNVFAQYGFIKNCWLRMGEKGPNKPPTPTYAFVTYSDPADAHKALQAPNHEKVLHGRNLRTSPADSWHQPAEDANGRVHWRPRGIKQGHPENPICDDGPSGEQSKDANVAEANGLNASEDNSQSEDSYNILDILNRDCMTHILSFVPVRDLIRSERVSKSWHNMVQEYFDGIRTFKTSWWVEQQERLTTAVLRRVLQRLGASLLRLHIDQHHAALNDRTAHTVGKFCPALEELKVVGMYTKNWNPLIYGCKHLKNLSFISCSKLSDSSLVHLVKADSCIESLTVANNTHVTGLFLAASDPRKLHSLSFYNCYSLQGTVLCAALDTLPNLTTLKLDICPVTMWKVIPLILTKVPKLNELSLSEYMCGNVYATPQSTEEFCKALSQMTELITLNLSRNVYINNAVLKQISQTCIKLESLDISSCNSAKSYLQAGVTDEGVRAVCSGCPALRSLDVSYLGGVTGGGLAGGARALRTLLARGSCALQPAGPAACLRASATLQEVDLCGCDHITAEVVSAGVESLQTRSRPLLLRLANTPAANSVEDFPRHPLLRVDTLDDRSNPNLRPDFVDVLFENSSEGSDDLHDHIDLVEHDLYEDFDDFFDQDDDFFLDENDDALNVYAYGIHSGDIFLL